MRGLSLILPCYNEAKSLAALVERNRACLNKRGLDKTSFELILVDNGSADDTQAILKEILSAPENSFVRTVHVPVNKGYGHGVHQGILAARFETVGWTHADEQCDPEDAFRGWERWTDLGGKHLVKGTRHGRSVGSWLFSRAFELVALLILRRRLHEINAQPKVFDAALISSLSSPPPGFAYDLYVLLSAARAGLKCVEIPVLFPPRKHGESRWAATFRSRVRTIRSLIDFMRHYR